MTQLRLLSIAPYLVLLSVLATPAVPSVWAQTDREILSGELPGALEGMDIREGYMPAGGFPRAGVIHALQGTLIVVHRADRTAFAASEGDPIHENDELFTLTDSRCRIRFLSEDVVSIAPETRFSVERFLDQPGQGEKTSLFGLLRGKAMFYALRLFRYRDARFEVETPTAVVGVRGTQFGMHVFELEGRQAGERGVQVAERGPGLPVHLSQADSGGPDLGTIVACGDGELDVIDRESGRQIALVRPNENFNTVTGQKAFDPRNRTLNGIAADTQVRKDGDEDAAEGPDGTENQAQPHEEETQVAGLDTMATTSTDLTDLTADVTLQETGLEAEKAVEPLFEPPGHWYFAAMLRDQGTGFIEDVYVGGADGTIISDVPSMIDPDRFLFNEETDTVTEVRIAGAWKEAAVTWKRTTLGQSDYMAWGYWTSDMTFTGSGPYQFIEKMWWVDGDLNDRTMPKGVIAYQGGAQGTYSSPSETHDLKGSFSCRVDFEASSHQVQDFTMNVAGGGKTASIYKEHVSFDPALEAEGYRFFMFTDGAWSLHGNTPTDKECQGIVYGGGQGIGGSCGMYNASTEEGYAGIFHGQAE